MSKGLKITSQSSVTNVTYPGPLIDRYTGPEFIGGAYVGGTGGLTSVPGRQIQPNVKVGAAAASVGSIIAQKGAHKFRVTNGTNTGTCKLVNLLTPTVNNTMSIQIMTAQTTAFANLTVPNSGATNTFGWITYATANLNSYSTPSTSSVWTGSGFTGTASVISYTVSSGLANVNVAITSQTVTNVSGTGIYQTVLFASRIVNRYVYDFGSDGYPVSSTSGSFTGNANNPNKYKYHLSTPTSTYVMVNYA